MNTKKAIRCSMIFASVVVFASNSFAQAKPVITLAQLDAKMEKFANDSKADSKLSNLQKETNFSERFQILEREVEGKIIEVAIVIKDIKLTRLGYDVEFDPPKSISKSLPVNPVVLSNKRISFHGKPGLLDKAVPGNKLVIKGKLDLIAQKQGYLHSHTYRGHLVCFVPFALKSQRNINVSIIFCELEIKK